MLRYLLRRLIFALLLVLVVSSAAILLTRLAPGDLTAELATADVSILLQPHSSYDLDELAQHAKLLFDTRGKIDNSGVARL